MDKVSYQNGFICGMATKGLVRSGELYKPLIWNDSGEYGYFYIDFRRNMQPFSTGMWNESIVVHDSVQISATAVSSKMSENPYIPFPKTVDVTTGTRTDTVIENGTLILYSEIV